MDNIDLLLNDIEKRLSDQEEGLKRLKQWKWIFRVTKIIFVQNIIRQPGLSISINGRTWFLIMSGQPLECTCHLIPFTHRHHERRTDRHHQELHQYSLWDARSRRLGGYYDRDGGMVGFNVQDKSKHICRIVMTSTRSHWHRLGLRVNYATTPQRFLRPFNCNWTHLDQLSMPSYSKLSNGERSRGRPWRSKQNPNTISQNPIHLWKT